MAMLSSGIGSGEDVTSRSTVRKDFRASAGRGPTDLRAKKLMACLRERRLLAATDSVRRLPMAQHFSLPSQRLWLKSRNIFTRPEVSNVVRATASTEFMERDRAISWPWSAHHSAV